MQAAVKAQGPVAAALPAARRPRPAAAATSRPGLRMAVPERWVLHHAPAQQLATKASSSGAAAVEQAPAQQVSKSRAQQAPRPLLCMPPHALFMLELPLAAQQACPQPCCHTGLSRTPHACCVQAPAPPAEVKYASTLEVLPLNPKCDTIRVSCSERLSEVEFK